MLMLIVTIAVASVFIFGVPTIFGIIVTQATDKALYQASIYDGVIMCIALIIFGVALL